MRAEAASRIDAARATLEQERSERLAAVNAAIAERRSAAAAEVEASQGRGPGNGGDGGTRRRRCRRAVWRPDAEPDDDDVTESVSAVMSAGVTR